MSDFVSICTVTMDRADLTAQCLGPSLATVGYPFELLSTDNGSTDKSVIDYVSKFTPAYHRCNAVNEGYAKAMGQLFLRAKGDYICMLDPDILVLTPNWLAAMVDCYKAIQNSAIAGIHCVMELWPAQIVNDRKIHPGWHTFGVKFFSKKLLETLGYLYEGFGVYGMEDVDMNYRINKCGLGLMNYYVGGLTARHCGNDVNDNTPYRKMKWAALAEADKIFQERVKYYEATQDYYVPPPALR